MTKLVALTGGIGTGKSTVARMFEKLGATVIDADAIVHELQAAGSPVLAEIVTAFGREVLQASGELDRPALAAIVFRDEKARAELNAIVHPRVGAEMARRIAAAVEAQAAVVILEIPLFFEGRKAGTGSAASLGVGMSVLAFTPEATQIERTCARDGCDRDEALRRVGAQLPIEEKRDLADAVIDNSGSLEATERQVRALYERITREEAAAS